MDQNGAPGMSASPSGYATNAKPGPVDRGFKIVLI